MTKETRLAIGIVAGVIMMVAGGFWLFSGSNEEPVKTADTPAFEEHPVPAYEYEDSEGKLTSDTDEMAGDMTRIIVQESAISNDVDVGQVLTGKVIIDDQVVQQPTAKNE